MCKNGANWISKYCRINLIKKIENILKTTDQHVRIILMQRQNLPLITNTKFALLICKSFRRNCIRSVDDPISPSSIGYYSNRHKREDGAESSPMLACNEFFSILTIKTLPLNCIFRIYFLVFTILCSSVLYSEIWFEYFFILNSLANGPCSFFMYQEFYSVMENYLK